MAWAVHWLQGIAFLFNFKWKHVFLKDSNNFVNKNLKQTAYMYCTISYTKEINKLQYNYVLYLIVNLQVKGKPSWGELSPFEHWLIIIISSSLSFIPPKASYLPFERFFSIHDYCTTSELQYHISDLMTDLRCNVANVLKSPTT